MIYNIAYTLLGIAFAVSFYKWLTSTKVTEYREDYPEKWSVVE